MSNKSLTLGGVTVDFSSITSAISSILSGFASGSGASDILATMEDDAEAAFTSIASSLFPNLVSEIEQLEAVLGFLNGWKSMSQDDVNAWMDRFGAGGDTAS